MAVLIRAARDRAPIVLAATLAALGRLAIVHVLSRDVVIPTRRGRRADREVPRLAVDGQRWAPDVVARVPRVRTALAATAPSVVVVLIVPTAVLVLAPLLELALTVVLAVIVVGPLVAARPLIPDL